MKTNSLQRIKKSLNKQPNNTHNVNIRFDVDDVIALEFIAKETNSSIPSVIKQIIKDFINDTLNENQLTISSRDLKNHKSLIKKNISFESLIGDNSEEPFIDTEVLSRLNFAKRLKKDKISINWLLKGSSSIKTRKSEEEKIYSYFKELIKDYNALLAKEDHEYLHKLTSELEFLQDKTKMGDYTEDDILKVNQLKHELEREKKIYRLLQKELELKSKEIDSFLSGGYKKVI